MIPTEVAPGLNFCHARIETEYWHRWVGRVEVYPRYLRIPDAVRYCGLPRAEVERLCATRDFESFCYKLNAAATHGVRLIVVASINLHMDRIARENMPLELVLPGDPHEMESATSVKARIVQSEGEPLSAKGGSSRVLKKFEKKR